MAADSTATPLSFLVVIQSPEYLRYFDGTLRLLLERGHAVRLAVNQQSDKKPVTLQGLADHPRLSRVGVLEDREDIWGQIGRGLRGTVDFVRFLHPRYADAPALRARMKRKVLPKAFRGLDMLPTVPAGLLRPSLRFLQRCEEALPASDTFIRLIREAGVDAVVVSPLIDAASEQVEIVKAARAAGVPVGACIASWDNLTNKGLLRVQPDLITVWNEAQRAEAVEFHDMPADRVVVTGAQLFDRWFERKPSMARDAFCARVGLPGMRPFLLFTGSSSFISETNAEVAFVRRWLTALRASSEPAVRDAAVLVRPHPYNYTGWLAADLTDLGPVAVWPKGPYSPVAEESRDAYFDSLYHSAAIVGINTSAMVEAAIVGRPVFSILAPEFAGTQEGTLHFHHLLVENGGCVSVAATLDDHVAQLSAVLQAPGALAAQTRDFVGRFIRPHGLDRPATPILADALEQLARGARVVVARRLSALPLRTAVLAIAAPAGAYARLTDRRWRGRARKETGRAIRRFGKRLRKAGRRSADALSAAPAGLDQATASARGAVRQSNAGFWKRARRFARQARFRAGTIRHRLIGGAREDEGSR